MPVLAPSDVLFMYHASRDVYRAYGATALAWGGKPTPEERKEAEGARWFGSVGMVTEFSKYYERDPATYEQGLCRDVHGHPVKVPWLTDHRHKGIPYWWCCTNQPRMRDFINDKGGRRASRLHLGLTPQANFRRRFAARVRISPAPCGGRWQGGGGKEVTHQ